MSESNSKLPIEKSRPIRTTIDPDETPRPPRRVIQASVYDIIEWAPPQTIEGSPSDRSVKQKRKLSVFETGTEFILGGGSPTKRSRESSLSGTTSPTKSESSLASSDFSKTIKQKTKVHTKGKCWLCGRLDPEIAHVIPQADRNYDRLILRGILDPFSIKTTYNSIALCALCHVRFDDPIPSWIMIPLNLKHIVRLENEDYIQRVAQPRKRISPSASLLRLHMEQDKSLPAHLRKELKASEVDGILYQGYLRQDFFKDDLRPPTPLGKVGKPKIWHGCPQAALIHALRVLAFPDDSEWLPPDVLQDLKDLVDAWRREVPDVEEPTIRTTSGSSRGATSDEEETGGSRGHSAGSRSNEATSSGTSDQSDEPGSEPDGNEYGTETSANHDTELTNVRQLWQYGPDYTSSKIVELFHIRGDHSI